jgi:DNA-binding response OmpR family regulator
MLVEDHDPLRELLSEHLRSRGHHVLAAPSAEAMDELYADRRIDIYLLDLNLPGEDGLSLSRRLRGAEPHCGIVMLTARDGLSDRVSGYSEGADAYLAKPVAVEELDAVIAALSRRVRPAEAARLRLQTDSLRLFGPDGDCKLSAAECTLLAGLARAPDRTLEVWQLIELLGKSIEQYRKASLEVHIVRLRAKLTQVGGPRDCIVALRGKGYRLATPISLQGGG